MGNLIPAAPGWYVRSVDLDVHDPIIAWTTAIDLDGTVVLLPFVPNGEGFPPQAIDLKAFPRHQWEIVYHPNRDPEIEG